MSHPPGHHPWDDPGNRTPHYDRALEENTWGLNPVDYWRFEDYQADLEVMNRMQRDHAHMASTVQDEANADDLDDDDDEDEYLVVIL